MSCTNKRAKSLVLQVRASPSSTRTDAHPKYSQCSTAQDVQVREEARLMTLHGMMSEMLVLKDVAWRSFRVREQRCRRGAPRQQRASAVVLTYLLRHGGECWVSGISGMASP